MLGTIYLSAEGLTMCVKVLARCISPVYGRPKTSLMKFVSILLRSNTLFVTRKTTVRFKVIADDGTVVNIIEPTGP